MKNLICVVALLMTVGPAFAQTGELPGPPQTFVLTGDGTCSITSDNLVAHFSSPGVSHGWIAFGARWSARWETTGCKLPILVAATVNVLNSKKEVLLPVAWWVKVPAKRYAPSGAVKGRARADKQLDSIKLIKIQLVTKEQFKAGKLPNPNQP